MTKTTKQKKVEEITAEDYMESLGYKKKINTGGDCKCGKDQHIGEVEFEMSHPKSDTTLWREYKEWVSKNSLEYATAWGTFPRPTIEGFYDWKCEQEDKAKYTIENYSKALNKSLTCKICKEPLYVPGLDLDHSDCKAKESQK